MCLPQAVSVWEGRSDQFKTWDLTMDSSRYSLCCLSASLAHAFLQECLCPAFALLTPTLLCPLCFLSWELMAAASPGNCWTATNPGPQPWYQPSLTWAHWGMVGLCLMGEGRGRSCYCWHLLSQLVCAPWLAPNSDTPLLAELFVWACSTFTFAEFCSCLPNLV